MTQPTEADQFGRPACLAAFAVSAVVVFAAITGSLCPPRTGSVWPPLDTCDTTTTLCLGRFPSPTSSRTFPGSLARCKFDVNAHTTTVVMREWLKTSS